MPNFDVHNTAIILTGKIFKINLVIDIKYFSMRHIAQCTYSIVVVSACVCAGEFEKTTGPIYKIIFATD